MSSIIIRQSAIDELKRDPEIQQWRRDKSGRNAPFLRYYRRSYSTFNDGTVTEHGDGFTLTTIDPHDPDETRGIVIKSAAVASDFDILVGAKEAIMSVSFAIGWTKKFTYEPDVSS